jgi:error-prone DNA polymerase
LSITLIDPGRNDLLLERLEAQECNELPDIGVDFEHERREAVIQWVYEPHNSHCVALCCTLSAVAPTVR